MASVRPLAAPAVPVEAAATAIFRRFDKNNDGRLNRAELTSFVQQVNPSMRFTDDQMEAILDELLIEYSAHADSEGMKLSGLVAAYRDGVGNVSADLSALGLRAEEVLSLVAATTAAAKKSPSPRKKSLSPSPPPFARPRQLALRATYPSRSPSPVRRAAAALADVLALTSPEKFAGGRKNGKAEEEEQEEGGLPQSPAIAEAFRAAGFAKGRPPTESEEGEGAAADVLAGSPPSSVAGAAAEAASAPAPAPAPPAKRRFWPPAVRAANSSPMRPRAMTRPAATAAAAAAAAAALAAAKEEGEGDLVPISAAHRRRARPLQQQHLSFDSGAEKAVATAVRAVRFDLSAFETPPPQTRKRHGDENEKNDAADAKDEDDQNNSSDADDEACIASLMAQGEAAASAGRHAAAAAAYGSAAKLAAGRCSSRRSNGGNASSSSAASQRDYLTPAPRPRVCSRALFRLGNSLFAMGQPGASEAAYLEALRVMEEDFGDDQGENGDGNDKDETSTRREKRASSSSDARLATSLRVNLGIALEAQGMLAAAADQYAAAAAAADGLAEREREKRNLAALGAGTVTATAAAAFAAAKAAAEKPPAAAPHPAHSRAYKLLGSALFALGRPAAARDALQRALSIDPGYADAHCDLGCALCALGDAAGAAAAFSAALSASSNDGDAASAGETESGGKIAGLHREALFNLANLRRQTGDFAAAVCGYDRVLALDPGHWRAHLGRAVALLGSKRDGDARGALRIACALSGVPPSALDAELRMLREAAAAPNPERATLAAAMAAVADRAAAEVAKERK